MIKVLIFPCGSEVGLEIQKSLKSVRFIELWGASSVKDHGEFSFENYIGNLPYIDDPNFLSYIKKIILDKGIDVIFPAMDKVANTLKKFEKDLKCKVITSNYMVTDTAMQKKLTYNKLQAIVKTPRLYKDTCEISRDDYPVFIKPNVGYGSKDTYLVKNERDLKLLLTKKRTKQMLIMEYLPGDEYTVDCFSDKQGKLLFAEGRKRNRIKSGISVNTLGKKDKQFRKIADCIAKKLKPSYSWFIQLKEDDKGNLTLLEIATRIAGSSSFHRVQGINFSLLSIYAAYDIPVDIKYKQLDIELDRALTNSYKHNIEYENVYVDLDDCLIINGKVNTNIIKFLYQSLNEKKQIYLITRHKADVYETLSKYRIQNIFNHVIHIKKENKKSNFITHKKSIFIDDSFSEREEVYESLGIPTFSPDAIELLLENKL